MMAIGAVKKSQLLLSNDGSDDSQKMVEGAVEKRQWILSNDGDWGGQKMSVTAV